MIQYYSSVIKTGYIFLVIFLIGCQTSPSKKFSEVSKTDSGIDFRNQLTHTTKQNIIEYLYYYNGGGVALGDINNDGLLDIYLSANQLPNRLYINKGNLEFEDLTEAYGLPISNDTTKWSTGVTLVDVNADGFIDIYECVVGDYKSFHGHNKLYLNYKGEKFIESSSNVGLDFSGFSTQAAFFDYDLDGDLDVYLMNHSVHGTDTYGNSNLRFEKDQQSGDRLFQNKLNESGAFVDVTDEAGIHSSRIGYGLGLSIADLNNDALPDIYVGNDFHEDDYLYINNGDGSFIESADKYLGHTSQFTMGVDIADINRDGLVDIFSLDMMPADPTILLKSAGDDNNLVKDIKKSKGFKPQFAKNALQINFRTHFKELAQFYDVHATDWSWSVLIQDYDNDLDQDFFITNGIYKRPNDLDYIKFLSSRIQKKGNNVEELIARMPSEKVENVLYENEGDLNFSNSTSSFGLSKAGFSNGAAYGDLDNDGDLDLVINNLNDFATLFENVHNGGGNFLNLSLRDKSSANYQGLGSKVTVYADSITLTKEISLSRGFQSSISPRLHFGLGALDKIDSLHIQWPDGWIQTEYDLQINQFEVIQRQQENLNRSGLNGATTVFDTLRISFVHKEDEFQDFQVEKLLPWSLSKEGPALAKADLNGDGLDDFYIGGAHFQTGGLFLSNIDSSYELRKQYHFERDAGYEDVSSQFIDINNDGLLDLIVASGGGRFPEGHPLLEDRIYLNDGLGNFKRWIVSMPKINSSTISTYSTNDAKYVFIGSRSKPMQYGQPAKSYLSIWQHSKLADIEFYDLGMITDSEWINFDNAASLLVVGEWMPIKLLELSNDSLIEAHTSMFDGTNGLWNSITTGDLNGDGMTDFFFGNMGLNSSWKPTSRYPIELYSADFDSNGQTDPIIFNFYNSEHIPFTPKSELTKQLPTIQKYHPNTASFSKVRSLNDLINVNGYEPLIVNTCESKLLLSAEDKYEWASLPQEFQFGSIQDASIQEGRIIYVGNDFTTYSILGPSDSNHGGIGILVDGKIRWENLHIPFALDYRRIMNFTTDKMFVVPNSAAPFFMDIN